MPQNQIWLLIGALYGLLFPVLAGLIWQSRTKCAGVSYFGGAFCFIVFAFMLEQIPHYFFLASESPVSEVLRKNALLYAVYGASMAGIFEETGRYFGFKVLLKKKKHKSNSIAYGIGHGGLEIVLLMGIPYLFYFLAVKGIVPAGSAAVLQAASMSREMILLAMGERLSAFLLHIGLSILVFMAVRRKGKFLMFPLAVLLHILADLPAGLYQAGALPLYVTEIITAVFAIAVFIYAVRAHYRKGR